MIRLSSETYFLKSVSPETFWSKLDAITCGQSLNPELSYSTQFWGNFDNIFAGRQVGNRFSIYLYRPIEKGMRTEILAKGTVRPMEGGISIDVRYEVPLWSILVFLFIGGIAFLMLLQFGIAVGLLGFGAILLVYALILFSNHSDVTREVFIQFKKIEGNQ